MRVKILGISFGIIILICLAGSLSCLNLQEETQEEKQNIPSTWNETPGLNTSEGPQKEDLLLSDFPDVFKNDTIIVIGENASQIEKESSEAIAAQLENLTGNMTIIKNETTLTEDNKTEYNLILVGAPSSNSLLQEVYNLTNATRVTEEYPGENKGILEILWNPWNDEKAMLIVGGSDYWGVKAGSVKLEQICGISKSSIVTNYDISYNVPSGPILMSPENGTYTTDHIITFGWYNEEWAQKYFLQVDNNSDFSSPEIETYVVESQFTLESPLPDGTYYWRVKADDGWLWPGSAEGKKQKVGMK
jgi:hypothetical protein